MVNQQARSVLIGVQARTNSERLPGKINLEIDGKTILQRVVGACENAAAFVNRNFNSYQCIVNTAVLAPSGDPLIEQYKGMFNIHAFPGVTEEDVLSRYWYAAELFRTDFVVRITADCVFTAPYLISRCIKSAIFKRLDYTSNCILRTFREGLDVEVISRDLLDWLDENSKGEEREHVTLLLKDRDSVPKRFRFGHVFNTDTDDSHLKTSIDTMEDYVNAVAEIDSYNMKRKRAMACGDLVL